MAIRTTPPLPKPDFERIAQVCLGIIDAEGAPRSGSCLLFAGIGAAILREAYGKGAEINVGAAGFYLETGVAFAFDSSGDAASGDDDAPFHAWVELQGWALDFSCIAYPLTRHRWMFQQPLAKARVSAAELDAPVSFYLRPSPPQRSVEVLTYLKRPAIQDLLGIACQWYRKPPKLMVPIGLADKQQTVRKAALSRLKLDGAWVASR